MLQMTANQHQNSSSSGTCSSLSASSLAHNTLTNGNNGLATNMSQNGLLDLIMCKMVAPFHVVNDPRLLECGSSACYQCILASKDHDRNLKCPYCNGLHKIPIDSNKLLVNKNLNSFVKFNLKQLNQSFSKQLEDSMFTLERKKTFNLANF
jgi:hypothetical protein